MKKTLLMTVIAAGVLFGGISAPIAGARPSCQNTDFKSVCQTRGSVSIKARPGTVAPPGNMPHIPWIGAPGGR